MRFAAHGVHRLRNVTDPVKVVAALPTTGAQSELVTDPLCRTAVDPDGAVGTLAHDERTYYFCSLECAARFVASPETYEKTEPLWKSNPQPREKLALRTSHFEAVALTSALSWRLSLLGGDYAPTTDELRERLHPVRSRRVGATVSPWRFHPQGDLSDKLVAPRARLRHAGRFWRSRRWPCSFSRSGRRCMSMTRADAM